MKGLNWRRKLFAAIAIAVLAATLPVASGASKALPYHGNVQSKIFHKSSCRYYNCKNCTEKFETREQAIKAGFRPCKVCKP